MQFSIDQCTVDHMINHPSFVYLSSFLMKASCCTTTSCCFKSNLTDKVRMYEEIMTNDDNLESNLLTSSLLKMLVQVELYAFTAQPQKMN